MSGADHPWTLRHVPVSRRFLRMQVFKRCSLVMWRQGQITSTSCMLMWLQSMWCTITPSIFLRIIRPMWATKARPRCRGLSCKVEDQILPKDFKIEVQDDPQPAPPPPLAPVLNSTPVAPVGERTYWPPRKGATRPPDVHLGIWLTFSVDQRMAETARWSADEGAKRQYAEWLEMRPMAATATECGDTYVDERKPLLECCCDENSTVGKCGEARGRKVFRYTTGHGMLNRTNLEKTKQDG